jgi:hypothetical protein
MFPDRFTLQCMRKLHSENIKNPGKLFSPNNEHINVY